MCRVWLSSDRANQQSMIDYAEEYMNYGIKVNIIIVCTPAIKGWSLLYLLYTDMRDRDQNLIRAIFGP